MGAQVGISEPLIQVNDVTVAYLSNSASFNRGNGEVTVIAQSVGGGGVEAVSSTNSETRLGMVKFSMRATITSDQLLSSWVSKIANNTVSFSDPQSGLSFILRGSSITNNPDMETGADGAVEVEFKGTPEGN